MDIAREIDFFDGFESEKGDYDVLGECAYRRLLKSFSRNVNPQPQENAIDLGCGTGAFTERLANEYSIDMTGMDISSGSIERAKRASTTVSYVVGDISKTELPTASFDIIVYSGVLHHCDESSLRICILEEGLRILKPGGRLFAYDPSWHSPSMWLYRDPASPLFSSKGKTENEVLLKRDALHDELSHAGFDDITIQGLGGITYRYVESSIARKILLFYNIYERLLAMSPLENRWGTFLTSFARKPLKQTCN